MPASRVPSEADNSSLLNETQQLDTRVIRIYVYYRAGRPVLIHARRESPPAPKFRWFHIGDDGLIKWGRGPYRVGVDRVEPCYAYDRAKAALVADPSLELWSVEGERDAETLWTRGHVAVSPADGAREPGDRIEWLAAYVAAVRSLNPRKVNVVADNDAAGIYTAEAVASALERAS